MNSQAATKSKSPSLKTVPAAALDPYLIYRSPFLRTLSGLKLLSGTILACGCIATPALAMMGPDGYLGAAAVALASLLPLGIHQAVIPGFVASIRIIPPSEKTEPESSPSLNAPSKASKAKNPTLIEIQESLAPGSILQLDTVGVLGLVKGHLETTADLRLLGRSSRIRWSNIESLRTGKAYYVEKDAGGPILRRVFQLIQEADKARASDTKS
jgi:hypothetical protein